MSTASFLFERILLDLYEELQYTVMILRRKNYILSTHKTEHPVKHMDFCELRTRARDDMVYKSGLAQEYLGNPI